MTTPTGRPLIRLDHVDSTMDVAASLAALGARSGTVVVARHQRLGRGRSGRSWVDQPGDALLLSVIVRSARSPRDLGAFSPLLGVAVARTVAPYIDMPVTVKWPNDVLVAHRKIAGILVTSRSAGGDTLLIVGIGINVQSPPERLPPTATSLAIEAGQHMAPDDLAQELFCQLDDVITSVESGFVDGLHDELGRRLAWRGERVRLVDGDRIVEGRLSTVDRDGALVLEDDQGQRVRIISGELTRGPQPVR